MKALAPHRGECEAICASQGGAVKLWKSRGLRSLQQRVCLGPEDAQLLGGGAQEGSGNHESMKARRVRVSYVGIGELTTRPWAYKEY